MQYKTEIIHSPLDIWREGEKKGEREQSQDESRDFTLSSLRTYHYPAHLANTCKCRDTTFAYPGIPRKRRRFIRFVREKS